MTREKTLKKVYEALVKYSPTTINFVANLTGLTVKTVAKARNYLVEKEYVRVTRFGLGGSVYYESNEFKKELIFGRVKSVEDNVFTKSIEIDGYVYNEAAEVIPRRYVLELDSDIMADLARYFKSPEDVPFF